MAVIPLLVPKYFGVASFKSLKVEFQILPIEHFSVQDVFLDVIVAENEGAATALMMISLASCRFQANIISLYSA